MLEFRNLFKQWLVIVLVSLTAISTAWAQDIAGGKDHPLTKRFAGSTLVGYEVRNFDRVELQTSTFTGYDLDRKVRVYAKPPLVMEGKITRMWYEAEGNTRSLELLRNYMNNLTSQGFTVLYDSTNDKNASQWSNFLAPYSLTEKIKNNRTEYVFYAASSGTIKTSTLKKDGTAVRLIAIDWAKADRDYKSREGAYIAVDVVETQSMKQNMVVVSAGDIDRAITTTGKVAIYGIYFDTGKADVKPESKPSLDQIAAYLKTAAQAKLHVVGHTDSVGTLAANMDLSRRRAEAVSQALQKNYGIAAARLTANGVASLAPVATNSSEDGRAKNRRVELVLQ